MIKDSKDSVKKDSTKPEHINYVDAIRIIPEDTLLTLTIYAEARGEGIEGQVAVGCVVRNRVVSRKQSYRDVILAPKQFSCWNNPKSMYDLWVKPNLTVEESRVRNQCSWVAHGIMTWAILDVTGGADHYANVGLLSRPKRWMMAYKKTRKIGHHTFYIS